jgi:ABC-type nitrate/sulfonate/bicarbonate transport system substrate-binding protein
MRSITFQLCALACTLFNTDVLALKIATSLQWIEHTPQPYAIKNFYKGSDTASLVSGGVANLASGGGIDLAANAETQGLLQYATHKNIRLIYVIVEAGYRVVANKASGITILADLKGKKVGTMPGTSAAYFINQLLGSVGLKSGDYSIVSGNICMKTPCGAGTFPQMITGKQVDAFGIWEPAVELGAEALGTNAVIFQNTSIYREVYSLYSTEEKLNDAATRKNIVAFIKALNQTLEVFRDKPESVYATVASAVGMDASVVQAVWPVHKWSGDIPSDLLDFLVVEDQYLAKQSGRAASTRADLATFIDSSVLEEAKNS